MMWVGTASQLKGEVRRAAGLLRAVRGARLPRPRRGHRRPRPSDSPGRSAHPGHSSSIRHKPTLRRSSCTSRMTRSPETSAANSAERRTSRGRSPSRGPGRPRGKTSRSCPAGATRRSVRRRRRSRKPGQGAVGRRVSISDWSWCGAPPKGCRWEPTQLRSTAERPTRVAFDVSMTVLAGATSVSQAGTGPHHSSVTPATRIMP
jgi:hypothetical protein